MKAYGKELILDMHECDASKFTRENIENFFTALCIETEMEPCDLHFWDYEGEPEQYEAAPDHLKGISAVQFISTSNITIHTLDVLKSVYINFFSCKDFKSQQVAWLAEEYFGGKVRKLVGVNRGSQKGKETTAVVV